MLTWIRMATSTYLSVEELMESSFTRRTTVPGWRLNSWSKEYDPFGLKLPYEPDGVAYVTPFDRDCDGDYDLLVSLANFDLFPVVIELYYYENVGTPREPAFEGYRFTNDKVFIETMADLDDDGDIEVMASRYYAEGLRHHDNCEMYPMSMFSFDTVESPIQFTNMSEAHMSSCDSAIWLWDFGDGSTSVEMHPLHHFKQRGTTNRVCLTVRDSRGRDEYCYDLPVTVGIKIRPDINPLELYPNPAENYIVLKLDESDVENYRYAEVFDIYGRLVMKTRLEDRSPGHVRIDLENVSPGLYTIRVNAERKTYIGQFIAIDR